MNHLSVSIPADRLLARSKTELEAGDYTLSIVIGSMAVEAFLAALFFKFKKMESQTYSWPTKVQEEEWSAEYKDNCRGFSDSIEFVAQKMTGMTFSKFLAQDEFSQKVIAGLSIAKKQPTKDYFQSELFNRRNKILHWGDMNFTQEEAEHGHASAIAIITVLKEIDRVKYGNL